MANDLIDLSETARLKRDEQEMKIALLVIGALFLVLFTDVLYLNFVKLNNPQVKPIITYQIQNFISPAVSPTRVMTPSPAFAINPSSSSTLSSLSSAPSPSATVVPTLPVVQTKIVKDYFIPFGSGTTQANTWTDIPGALVNLDFGQYPDIKQILFESSVYVPTANQSVSVRLFNETDQHPVWNSTVTMTSGNTSAYLTSPAVSYDTGMKLYQVQMETQLQAPANLVQARIHVVLN